MAQDEIPPTLLDCTWRKCGKCEDMREVVDIPSFAVLRSFALRFGAEKQGKGERRRRSEEEAEAAVSGSHRIGKTKGYRDSLTMG